MAVYCGPTKSISQAAEEVDGCASVRVHLSLSSQASHCRHSAAAAEEEAEEHQSNIISSQHVIHRQRCILFFSIAQEGQLHVEAIKWVEKGPPEIFVLELFYCCTV